MGGSQSTRKLSVDNENQIQVSQEALERIQSQIASQKTEPSQEFRGTYEPPKRSNEYAAEEQYWSKRIDELKRAHEQINAKMVTEYEMKLKEATELFNNVQQDPKTHKLPPCQQQKEKVLECYSANPGKSLMCSAIVSEFNDCVCRSRVAAVTAS